MAHWKHPKRKREEDCPDFANSRDAMACALETLSEEEWAEFITHLCGELFAYSFPQDFSHVAALLKATPKQLAIAFLKAKGKWRDA